MPELRSRRIDIARDHPAFAGHFPGQPLLPGVVLLGEVLEVLLGESPPAVGAQARVSAVKFLAPVRPGAAIEVRWSVPGEEAMALYKKGDVVKAKVLDVDVEKERISLGIKQLAGDPMSGDTYRKNQTLTVTVTEVTSGGIEVRFGEDDAPMTAFIRKSDLSRDRQEQRPERFAVGDRVDAQITNIDKAARRVSLSIKSLEMAEEKEAIEQFGSSDSGASLGDILGAALRERASKE